MSIFNVVNIHYETLNTYSGIDTNQKVCIALKKENEFLEKTSTFFVASLLKSEKCTQKVQYKVGLY